MGTTRISLETDLDKCISVIATAKARCINAIETGYCNPEDCACCNMGRMVSAEYNKFTMLDKLNIDMKVQDMLQQARYINKRSLRTNGRRITYTISQVMKVLFLMTFTVVMLMMCSQCSLPKPETIYIDERDSYEMRRGKYVPVDPVWKYVGEYVEMTREYEDDLNGDGEVTCIDRACIFKKLWDMDHQGYESQQRSCRIVRCNNKKENWHHLFIQVKFYIDRKDVWLSIEPTGTKDKYYMEDVWGRKYNPALNVTNETDYWLKQCGIDSFAGVCR